MMQDILKMMVAVKKEDVQINGIRVVMTTKLMYMFNQCACKLVVHKQGMTITIQDIHLMTVAVKKEDVGILFIRVVIAVK